jgi:hypothetical protein
MFSQIAHRSFRMKTAFQPKSLCRIQYASDFHLEFYDKQVFPSLLRPSAHILALAGDIGQPTHPLYSAFFDWAHDKWDHIFVVAGNHEFYNKKHFLKWETSPPETMESRLELCRALCGQWRNIHFLEKDSVHLEEYNTTFLGTTLWTHIPREKAGAALHMVNDYNYIAKKDSLGKPTRFSPYDSAALHDESVQWLNARIHECEETNKNVVVLTHHLPSQMLIPPKYKDHPSNLCFVSSLDDMIRYPIRAWICGHSHHQLEVQVQRDDPPTEKGTTTLAINAHGYNLAEKFEYNPEKVLSFSILKPEEPTILS